MANDKLEEQRQLAIETLNFFHIEHNKALFKLSAVRNQVYRGKLTEKDAIEAIRAIKRRLKTEFYRCEPFLGEKDKQNYFDLD